MPQLRSSLLVVVSWFIAWTSLHAQVTTPQPFLSTLSPAAGKAGSTVEVSITGTDLDKASSLRFSVPGITCVPKVDSKQQPVANQFVITIPAGIPTTTCDVSVVARYGISNPRRFCVTALPVVTLPGGITRPDKAYKAALNTAVFGTATKQAISYIQFETKKGTRLLVVCQSVGLDSRMDAAVSLRNPEGHTSARLNADGLLDFTAPADGVYMLEVSDLMYRGDADYPFLLTLTTGPVIQRAFDGGVRWTLYGRHFSETTGSKLQHDPSLERLQVTRDEAKKLLAANPVEVVRFGAENEPPSDAPAPATLQVPAEYNGWFASQGRDRIFAFEAKKGEVLWIELNCAGKGIHADPYKELEKGDSFLSEANDRTAVAGKTEFDAGWADPSIRFEAKEAGTYRIKLRNLYTNSAPEPFELTVRPAQNDFELVAIPSTPPKAKASTTVEVNALEAWRGGVAVLKVFALRHNGFTGAIGLRAEDLPPGVRFLGGNIAEGQSIGYAAFFAEESANEAASAVKLHGETGSPARGATAIFKVSNTAKESTLTRLTDEVTLGVVASDAPVTIEAPSTIVESDGKTKVSIPLQVKRRGDCSEAIKLTSLGVEGITAEIGAKATSGKLDVDLPKLKLSVGDHSVILQGIVKFKYRRSESPKAAASDLTFLVHSKPIIIRVKPAEQKPVAQRS
jgi:hypothetical protein